MLMQTHENRLAALREELARRGLDGFVVPIADEHLSEYVGDYAQRLAWLTGFAGSAGTGVVLRHAAAVFVDGRYTVQVRDQVDARLFEPVAVAETGVGEWLTRHAEAGATIGYDAWLHTRDWAAKLGAKLAAKESRLIPVTGGNPIDAVWADQPERSAAPLTVQPDALAGRSAADKRGDIAAALKADGLDATVMTALDSVAWTFNLRGGDIANTPVGLAYALVDAEGRASLFVDPAKLGNAVRAHLGNEVALRPYGEFGAALAGLAGRRVAADPERAPAAVFDALDAAGATVVAKRDPAVLMKACKNPVELAGTRAAHLRDGAALTRFLKWAAEELPKGGEDELSAAARLRAFREENAELVDLSFRTISATGPHGALPHYSVTEETNLPIEPGQLYLVDSGGQYRDGTTDITRVVAVGEPTDEMRRRYTQVLKGHVALARARFPAGTTGGALDVLARQYLWADGVDYAHGTGHGVGVFLSVHEGPQRIASFGGMNEPLRAGMILSNEPGYYREGAFGIRIENLVVVTRLDLAGAERPMLGFETISFAPLERELIDVALLGEEERAWVDGYHADVLAKIGPRLSPEDRTWLEARCAML